MYRAAQRSARSELVERLAGKVVELCAQRGIGGAIGELVGQLGAGQPTGPMAVGDDVGGRLSVDCEDHSLTSFDGIDHTGRPVA